MALDKRFERLTLFWSEEQLNKLINSTVMIVGIGGVGAMAIEALARSAIGALILVDNDEIDITNLNRQILATTKDIGKAKTEVMKQRVLDINPNCHVITYKEFFNKEKSYLFDNKIDFVVDAIDTITSKLDLIQMCQERNIPIISSLGMGNRVDPSQLRYTTLDKTTNDALARSMRQIARKRNMNLKIPVVISLETAIVQNIVVNADGKIQKEKTPPASNAFVPNAAGLMLSSYVVRKLIEK